MYLVANFKFLNLTWDLNVGVARIGNNRFQEQINDLEISLIYLHSDEMVYRNASIKRPGRLLDFLNF